jgi:hypothetical protein
LKGFGKFVVAKFKKLCQHFSGMTRKFNNNKHNNNNNNNSNNNNNNNNNNNSVGQYIWTSYLKNLKHACKQLGRDCGFSLFGV